MSTDMMNDAAREAEPTVEPSQKPGNGLRNRLRRLKPEGVLRRASGRETTDQPRNERRESVAPASVAERQALLAKASQEARGYQTPYHGHDNFVGAMFALTGGERSQSGFVSDAVVIPGLGTAQFSQRQGVGDYDAWKSQYEIQVTDGHSVRVIAGENPGRSSNTGKVADHGYGPTVIIDGQPATQAQEGFYPPQQLIKHMVDSFRKGEAAILPRDARFTTDYPQVES